MLCHAEYRCGIQSQGTERSETHDIDAADMDDEKVGAPFRVLRKKGDEIPGASAIDAVVYDSDIREVLGEPAGDRSGGMPGARADRGAVADEHDSRDRIIDRAAERSG